MSSKSSDQIVDELRSITDAVVSLQDKIKDHGINIMEQQAGLSEIRAKLDTFGKENRTAIDHDMIIFALYRKCNNKLNEMQEHLDILKAVRTNW